MNVYIDRNSGGISVSPASVIWHDYNTDFYDPDAVAFLVDNEDNTYIIPNEANHEDFADDENITPVIGGRLWKDAKVITFWNRDEPFFPYRTPSSIDVDNLKIYLKCERGIDISDFTLIRLISKDMGRMTPDCIVITMTVDEYIQRRFTGNEGYNDYMALKQKIEAANYKRYVPSTKTGIAHRDFWRHHEIGESAI